MSCYFYTTYPNTGGGLALIWKREIQLDIVNYMANHILAKVVEKDGFGGSFQASTDGRRQERKLSLGHF